MAQYKVLRCNGCKSNLVFHKMITWKRIFKIAKENGWLIKKTHQLCPECSFDLGMMEKGE